MVLIGTKVKNYDDLRRLYGTYCQRGVFHIDGHITYSAFVRLLLKLNADNWNTGKLIILVIVFEVVPIQEETHGAHGLFLTCRKINTNQE
jgi:hypothetical protein